MEKLLKTNHSKGYKNFYFKLSVTLLIVLSGKFNQELFASDYFWVGGSGNWSDISHWVTSSGGNTYHLQVPTPFDDVYFDENSFTDSGQVVTVNAGNYTCRNLNWSNVAYNPTFTNVNNYFFRIYGSLVLADLMNYNFIGDIYFEATTTGQTITSNGKKFLKNIYFNGLGGEWTLLDDFDASGNIIYVNSGTFNTNSKTISCEKFYSNTSDTRSIIFGSSIINVGSDVTLRQLNLNLIAGSSTINILRKNASISLSGSITLYDLNFTNDLEGSLIMGSLNVCNFNNVAIQNNATINGNFVFNNLSFFGADNTLKEGCIQKISGDLNINGNCSSPIFLHSSNDTIPAYINKVSDSIKVSYVFMRSVCATGGAVFMADNSSDIGLNNGWIFVFPTSLNLYWVGNSGNWDDPNHWSFTSGGAGGACVPSPFDDVFFDQNSFSSADKIVTINCKNAFCRDMTWTGVTNHPALAGTNMTNLNIYGSLRFSQAMNLTFLGKTYFKSFVTGRIVFSAGQVFNNNVYFDYHTGGWSLLDGFSAGNSTVFLLNGSLNLNSQEFECGIFNTNNINQRELFLTNSNITITSNMNKAWILNSSDLVFNAGTSTINFTNINGGMYNILNDTIDYYDVNFLNNEGFSYWGNINNVGRFHNVLMNPDATITGDIIVNNISLLKNNYCFESNKKIIINNNLITAGACNSIVFFYSSSDEAPSEMYKENGNITTTNVILKGITAGGNAIFTANNATDLGANSGWIINQHVAVDLFWVGETGNWNDPAHWSYTSGGIGGACIPTPFDNVFFDGNSFASSSQVVNVNVAKAFCHNMNWNDLTMSASLKSTVTGEIKIFGSLWFNPLTINNYSGYFSFESNQAGNTILSSGKTFLDNISFNGIGSWQLLDDINCSKIIQINNGWFISGNYKITTNALYSLTNTSRNIDLGSSKIIINSISSNAWYCRATNLTLNAGNSYIYFSSPNSSMNNFSGDTLLFNKVEFMNAHGTSRITSNLVYSKFKNVSYFSNGEIYGNNTFDTLTFYPSKTYTLESLKTQKIDKLINIPGNGCFPITLKSSQIGVQSNIYKSSGNVSVSFVEMRDQKAIGGASFFAGNNSIDVANNTNWSFGNPAGFQFGLPDSASLCPGDTLLLSTYNFVGGVSFKWQDGTYGATYAATQPGTYWVEVIYADGCALTDTAHITGNISPYVTAANDTSICFGNQIVLSATGPEGSAYLWSNNAVSAQISVSPESDTLYYVTATNVCGSATDSIKVVVHQLPYAEAGSNSAVCPGDSVHLNSSGPVGASYLWNNSVTENSILVSPESTTTYQVSVTDEYSCGTATDQVTVSVMLPMYATINSTDTIGICIGDSATLYCNTAVGSEYLWSTFEESPEIIVHPLTSGNYTVTATDSLGCFTATDDIFIIVSAPPTVDAGIDISICQGAIAYINPTVTYVTHYSWSTGDTTSSISFQPLSSTFCTLTVFGNCGFATDQVNITVNTFQDLQAEILDAHCDQNDGSILINNNLYSYLWSTGEISDGISNLSSGTYTVTASYNGCEKFESFTVENINSVSADFSYTYDLECTDNCAVNFDDQSQGDIVYRKWDFGNGDIIENAANVSTTFYTGGEYTVKLFVKDGYNCHDTITKKIEIKENNILFIPNAFTPNGDGLNDGFGPVWTAPEYIDNYKMIIVDNWGKILFETSDPNMLWNGKIGETDRVVPDGVYTYLIEFNNKDTDITRFNKIPGVVTLLGNNY